MGVTDTRFGLLTASFVVTFGPGSGMGVADTRFGPFTLGNETPLGPGIGMGVAETRFGLLTANFVATFGPGSGTGVTDTRFGVFVASDAGIFATLSLGSSTVFVDPDLEVKSSLPLVEFAPEFTLIPEIGTDFFVWIAAALVFWSGYATICDCCVVALAVPLVAVAERLVNSPRWPAARTSAAPARSITDTRPRT